MTTFEESVVALLKEQADRDYILISHPINRDLHQVLSVRLRHHKVQQKCTVFLTTFGGDAHAGFRVARCLQHNYQHVRLVVPSYCKSAGTLIAIAAQELALGDLGELGPLDLQFTKPSEVLERESGLDYMQGLTVALAHAQQAFTAFLEVRRAGMRLPTNQAGELASKIACGLVAPLYSQIDPNRIGEMQRAIKIAQEYGQRLNEVGKNLKKEALEKMVAEYPSHSFVIDRKEARNLFTSVAPMTSAEAQMTDTLWHLLSDQAELCHVCIPAQPASVEPNHADAQSVDEHSGVAEGEPSATSPDQGEP